jgi:hypothetical protein
MPRRRRCPMRFWPRTRTTGSRGWWICREAGVVTLYVDTAKLLPHTDPFNRQITIGLGCFLELMRMAASHDGQRVTDHAFPGGLR